MEPINIARIPLAKRPDDLETWMILVEQVIQGTASLFRDGSDYLVLSEHALIPLEYLCYDPKAGLRDSRRASVS
jgi:hypothetical protein